MLKYGTIDVGMPLVRLRERDDYAIFTHTVSRVHFHVYTTRDIGLSGDYLLIPLPSAVRGGSRYLEKNPNFEELGAGASFGST